MATAGGYVLLGVVDELVTSNTTFDTNKIGGEPDFASTQSERPFCSLCGGGQSLVVQVYCPLDDSPHHRILYVFTCVKSTCWSKSEGWTVLRSLHLDEIKNAEKLEEHQKFELWGGGDDDWGDGDITENQEGSSEANEIFPTAINSEHETMLSNMSEQMNQLVIDPQMQTMKTKSSSQTLTSYYVNVFDENDCAKWSHSLHKESQNSYKNQIPNNENETDYYDNCKLNAENYEQSEHSDKIFHKFLKKIQIYPEQVIRYSCNGDPVVAKKCTKSIPNCAMCGSVRNYEMQLMPALLPYLSDFSIEFSTVLIYTCSKNCSGKNRNFVTKEHIVYQDDPDLCYFKGQKVN